MLPVYETQEVLVLAGSNNVSLKEIEKIEKQLNKEIYLILASDETIQKGFEIIGNASQLKINQEKEIENICTPEQVIIIRNYAARLGLREEEVIMQMGLVVNEND